MRSLAILATAVVFAFVGSMPLAGPIALLTLSRAAHKRYGEALRIGLGAAAAEAIYAGLAFWGFATFLARYRLVVPISRAATAALLTVLGFRFMFWRLRDDDASDPQETGNAMLLGFSISALNPTLLLTWSAAVAFLFARGLEPRSAALAIPFGFCAGTGVAAWFFCLVKLVHRYGAKVPRVAIRWVIRTMGLALVAGGIATAMQVLAWLR
jgi:threonine/homoserine/homoserine lactone efflux protein